MKFKNINPVERYFEKVTLVLAAGAVCYFIYSNYFDEPNIVNNTLPGQVESVVSKALGTIEYQRSHQTPVAVVDGTASVPANKQVIPVLLPDWVDEYRRIGSKPLLPRLLAAVPIMAPPHVAVHVNGNGGGGGAPVPPIALPEIAALTDPDILCERKLVLKAQRTGVVARPEDITYVKGKVTLPLADLRASFAVDDTNNKYPRYAPHQTAITRLHVQRQERLSDGTWSDPVDVPPLPINTPPNFNMDGITDDKDIAARVGQLRARVLEIMHPVFYPAAVIAPPSDVSPVPAPIHPNPRTPVGPGRLPRPFVPPVMPPSPYVPTGGLGTTPPPGYAGGMGGNYGPNSGMTPEQWQRMQAEIQARQQSGTQGQLSPDASAGVPPAPTGTSGGGSVDPNTGVPGVNATGDPFGLSDDQTEAWFYDDQVKPEHTYKYRARIEVVNPLYHVKKPMTTNPPAGRDQLILASNNWAMFKEVTIDADEYFYLTNNGLAGNDKTYAYFEIYKWYQGGWVAVQDRVEIGSTLGGMKKVRLASRKNIDVDFGATYTVVDIRAISGAAGDNLQVVLQNNLTGQLVLHDILTDAADPQLKKLADSVQHKPGAP